MAQIFLEKRILINIIMNMNINWGLMDAVMQATTVSVNVKVPFNFSIRAGSVDGRCKNQSFVSSGSV